MKFAIPMPQSVIERLIETREYYLLVRVHDGKAGTVDLLPEKIGCTCGSSSQSWQFTLKNRGEYSEGLWSGLKAEVFFGVDGQNWSQIFSGYVSREGLTRKYGRITDDTVTLELEDRTRGKGTKRKPDAQVLADFTICNPDDMDNSLVHRYAAMMGVETVNCGKVAHVKDVVTIGDGTVWSELQSMQEAYDAYLYFDYMGRLFFHTAQEEGWIEPEPEWLLNGDPEYIPQGLCSPIVGSVGVSVEAPTCTRAKSTIKRYEHLDERVIYRNTENWDSTNKVCEIIVSSQASWPEEGVASLKFKDPETNEEYDYATDVVTPTVGADDKFDIWFEKGNLQLVSFNGSTNATRPEAGGVQILLKNEGTSPCTIKKFEVRGCPMRKLGDLKADDYVPGMKEEDHVDVEVDGKYGIDKTQMDQTLGAIVGRGKTSHRQFQVSTTFLPFVQRGMRMTLRLPRDTGEGEGETVLVELISYSHKQAGVTLATMRTDLVLKEVVPYDPVYNTRVVSTSPNIIPPIKGEDGKPATFLSFGLSSLVFHYDGTGTLNPTGQIITATAQGQNLPEDPKWTVNGKPYGKPGFMIEIPATMMEGRSFIGVDVSSGDLSSSNIITKLQDGTQGPSGWSSAQARLFKRSATAPAAYGGGVATYTFSTGTMSFDQTGSDGWSQTTPTGKGDIYVIYASASSRTENDDIQPNEWTEPVLFLEEAVPGQDGANVATVFIYKASDATPDPPTEAVTYRFSDGVVTGLTDGWGKDVPAGNGKVYVSTATAYSRTSTDTIQPSEWAIPQVFREKGEPGVAATIVVLSTEAVVIGADRTGSVPAGSFACDVLGYVGNTATRPASVKVGDLPAGMTATQSDIPGGKRLTLSYTAGALGNNDGGVIALSIECNGLTFPRTISWSKSKTGETGAPSVEFFVQSSQPTFSQTSRGVVKVQQTVSFTCERHNTAGAITWAVDGGLTITPMSGGTAATVVIPVGFNAAGFTVACGVKGLSTKTLTVNGVPSGSKVPMYLGKQSDAPTETPEGPLMIGDSYLSITNIPQRWNGADWILADSDAENYAFIMQNVLSTILTDGSEVNATMAALYGYFSNMAAVNIFADSLMANSASMKQLQTQTFDLQKGGRIKSVLWNDNDPVGKRKGFVLDGDTGNVDFGSGTWRGNIATGQLESREGDMVDGVHAYSITRSMQQRDVFTRLNKTNASGYLDSGAQLTTRTAVSSPSVFITYPTGNRCHLAAGFDCIYSLEDNSINCSNADFIKKISTDGSVTNCSLPSSVGSNWVAYSIHGLDNCILVSLDFLPGDHKLLISTDGTTFSVAVDQMGFGVHGVCQSSNTIYLCGTDGMVGSYDTITGEFNEYQSPVKFRLKAVHKDTKGYFRLCGDGTSILTGRSISSLIIDYSDVPAGSMGYIHIFESMAGDIYFAGSYLATIERKTGNLRYGKVQFNGNDITFTDGLTTPYGRMLLSGYDTIGQALLVSLDNDSHSVSLNISLTGRCSTDDIAFNHDAAYVVCVLSSSPNTVSIVKTLVVDETRPVSTVNVQHYYTYYQDRLVFDDDINKIVSVSNIPDYCDFILTGAISEKLHVLKPMSFENVDINIDGKARMYGAVFN